MNIPGPLLFLILLFLFPDLGGQEPSHEIMRAQYRQFDNLYGLDPTLINGIQYSVEFPGTKGHPFLDEEPFLPGSVQIGKQWYMDVMLAYNIHSQKIILKYDYSFGGSEQIVLHNEFIEGFWLGLRKFEKLDFPLTGEQFFQVIDAGELKCYYRWTRTINKTVYPYYYWTPNRDLYLFKDDELHPFQSKGAFIKLFEKEHRIAIRKYFKGSGIRLKSTSEGEMMELLQYCVELNEK